MRGIKRSYHSTTTTITTTSGSMNNYSACSNLQDAWQKACWKAMGLDDDWELIDAAAATAAADVVEQQGPSDTKSNTTNASVCDESLTFEVINLLPSTMFGMEDDDDDDDTEDTTTNNNAYQNKRNIDPWMNMAQQIQSNINDMRNFMQQKQYTYIQLTTSNAEASLIQSTITSFTATTANEIESLHQLLRNDIATTGSRNTNSSNTASTTKQQNHPQRQQHYSGIVQILMMELQDTIAQPFQQLTKLRQRRAVQIYQNPISCCIYIPKSQTSRKVKVQSSQKINDTTLELLGLDDDDETDTDKLVTTTMIDQRFIPTRPSHKLHQDFWKSYSSDGNNNLTMIQRPISMFECKISTGSHPTRDITHTPAFTGSDGDAKRVKVHDKSSSFTAAASPDFTDSFNENRDDTATTLQQESIQLQMKVQQNNDLDSVQQMEQTMIDITTLLSQFTNLVVEQQENIVDIYDTTTTTQDNIQKGTENLFQAKERVQSSKHYMATVITGMGILLLIFHWLRP